MGSWRKGQRIAWRRRGWWVVQRNNIGCEQKVWKQGKACPTKFVLWIKETRVNTWDERVSGWERTTESLSCNSSSLLVAEVLSFLASSALLTESVSFLSLACSLCSINCRFFACESLRVWIGSMSSRAYRFACTTLLVFYLRLIESTDQDSKHSFTTFAVTTSCKLRNI